MPRVNSAGMFLLSSTAADSGVDWVGDVLARIASICIRTSIGSPTNRFITYTLERFTSTDVQTALDGTIYPVTINGKNSWNFKLTNANYTAEQLEIYCHRHFITVVCAKLFTLSTEMLWRELRLDSATGLGAAMMDRTNPLPIKTFKAIWHESLYTVLNDAPLEHISSKGVGETVESEMLECLTDYDYEHSSEWFEVFKRAAVAPGVYRAMHLVKL